MSGGHDIASEKGKNTCTRSSVEADIDLNRDVVIIREQRQLTDDLYKLEVQ